MVAGHESFVKDPQLNLAKVLIAFFGIVNTTIILIQIHCVYNGSKRQPMTHKDSSIVAEGIAAEDSDFKRVANGDGSPDKAIIFRSRFYSDDFQLINGNFAFIEARDTVYSTGSSDSYNRVGSNSDFSQLL